MISVVETKSELIFQPSFSRAFECFLHPDSPISSMVGSVKIGAGHRGWLSVSTPKVAVIQSQEGLGYAMAYADQYITVGEVDRADRYIMPKSPTVVSVVPAQARPVSPTPETTPEDSPSAQDEIVVESNLKSKKVRVYLSEE